MRSISLLMVAIGLFLTIAGGQLISLGGSWFYLVAGMLTLVSGALLLFRKTAGAYLYGLVFIATLIWAYMEAGTWFWGLFPRIFMPLVLMTLILVFLPFNKAKPARKSSFRAAYPPALVLVVAVVLMFSHVFRPHNEVTAPAQVAGRVLPAAAADGNGGDWTHYARDGQGRRYAPFSQIDPNNVRNLQVAWQYRTGDIADGTSASGGPAAEEQNTPLQVGDTVYGCTPHDKVYALNADTGEVRWEYDAKGQSPMWQRCRSLGYADMSKNTFVAAMSEVALPADATQAAPAPVEPASADTAADAACRRRIVVGTIDARLIELDAQTGKPCEAFGRQGTVNLKDGMGEVKPGYYMQTSGPTVIENGLIVIAGWVVDNQSVGEPSGVVRGFDARNGDLVWAWDLGNPAITQLPPPGETYTRGTPNVWTTPAYDDQLGLVYLPTGNTTPDFWGGERTAAADAYNSSVVALDYRTGKEKWKFQTVHHDLWDYDLPSQPALYDIPDGNGGTLPALIQLTKRGQIFMLDRRDGTPIAQVEEKPVPTDVAEGDRISPTQPYSVGMPVIGAKPLQEKDMWGMTMLDQLICRVQFRKLHYEGDFTPPSTKPTLQQPGNIGGMNWGSATIDEPLHYLIVNDIRIPLINQLVARAEAEKYTVDPSGHGNFSPQAGTPFGLLQSYFLSPLGVPCTTPPLGSLTAIDLTTRQIVWQVPLGSTQDSGPLGIKTGLPMQVGMPTMGASLATGGGLLFFTGTQDYFIRAIDVRSGEVVWKDRLPVGGQSTPMSYVSPTTGRQYVLFTAGGARGQPDRGDYVIAYALPE
ncbi:MAG: membrane-bound PQQ-dependent dehydrogenase, glucose/quinate/shikimate family [Xanthomonadaceae bacterium]|jgi:quinate dehydrogenase (quinone)|nr:membrane-bound PQQ-dependent dehydrogenase, glucose/quinate/shikimate family [Xanthomonadaceae bacterium]